MMKLQSAIQYLTTYAWAILVVAVVAVILFTVIFNPSGIFSPKLTPGGCQTYRPFGPLSSAQINLEGTCNNELPQYVSEFNFSGSGNGFINVGTRGLPVGSAARSVFAWVYFTGNPTNYTIFSYGTNTSNELDDFAITTGNILSFSANSESAQSGIQINPNSWNFVGYTYNPGTSQIVFYVDGTSQLIPLSGSAPLNTVLPGTDAADIGKVSNGGSNYFRGEIANLQVYNTSFSGNDVSTIYAEGIGGTPIALQWLVGWWPLNGNPNDYSGNLNSGTATGVQYTASWLNRYGMPAIVFYPNYYTLTTSANPASEGAVSPSTGVYNANSIVTISATANTGDTFNGWTCGGIGCYSGSNTVANIVMSGPITETANFGYQTATYTYQYCDSNGITSASCTISSGGDFFCNGADGNGQLTSFSWTQDTGSQNSYASDGHQSPATCSDTGATGDMVVGGVGISPAATYTTYAASTATNSLTFSSSYTVANTGSLVVISISCGFYHCSGITVPSGCQQLFYQTGPDGFETSYAAVCSSQNAGSYTVNDVLPTAGGSSIAAYVFNPCTNCYTLTTAANPSSEGSVSPSTGNYVSGSTVTLTATPNFGYLLSGWSCTGSGCYSGTNTVANVVISSPMSETANFQVATYSLTTSASPAGDGTISPSSGNYAYNSIITVNAIPNSGYAFISWSCTGGISCASITSNSFSFAMPANAVTVNATFASTATPYQLTASASPNSIGNVVVNGVTNPAPQNYVPGNLITISEIPLGSASFTGWSCTGGISCSTNSNTLSFNMPANTVTVTAGFASTPYATITLTNNQPEATGSNFQQLLVVPDSLYNGYINSQWNNVEFTSSQPSGIPGNTVLEAWIETNASSSAGYTNVWLLLPSGIAANSNTVVYMNFLSNNVLSASGPTGEAPQLSTPYGQYDDGNSIFLYYNGGQSISGLSATHSATLSLSQQANPYGATTNVISLAGSGSITESQEANAWYASPVIGDNFIIEGWLNLGSNHNGLVSMRGSSSNSAPNYAMGPGWTGVSGKDEATIEYENGATNVQLAGSGTYGTGWYWNYGSVSGSSLTNIIYSGPEASVLASNTVSNTVLGASNMYVGIGTYNGSASPAYFFTTRVRLYPPNGIMPGVSFGSACPTCTYSFTGNAVPSAGGNVLPSSGSYTYNSLVSVSAVPNANYAFYNWTCTSNISCSTLSNSLTFGMPAAAVSVTANFVSTTQPYLLTTSANPTAGGNIIVNGVTSSGAANVIPGNFITVNAVTSGSSFGFTGWTCSRGISCSTASNSITFNMPANAVTVTANFANLGSQIWFTEDANALVGSLSDTGNIIGTYASGNTPQGIAIDKSGNIWIPNENTNTVTEISNSGNLIGTYSIGTTANMEPDYIAIDENGDAWVADLDAAKVTELSSSGNIIRTITVGTDPAADAVDSAGNVWITNELSQTVTKISSSTGNVLGTFSVGGEPFRVAIDGNGDVWISLVNKADVEELSPSGNAIGTYSSDGTDPDGISIDRSGNVWVADELSARVAELSNAGTLLHAISVGTDPFYTAVDGGGNVFVTNEGSGTITKISSSGFVQGNYIVGASSGDVWGIAILPLLGATTCTACTYSFTGNAVPSAGGSASPTSGSYAYGSNVAITATPNAGYGFIGWTCKGSGCYYGNSIVANAIIDGNTTETANFGLLYSLTFTANTASEGSIVANGITNPGVGNYLPNIHFVANAVPTSGNAFITWSCTSGITCNTVISNTLTFNTISSNTIITANFASTSVPYQLTISGSPSSEGNVVVNGVVNPGTGNYVPGNLITIYAVANPLYSFAGWTCSTNILCTTTSNTLTFNMPANAVTVTADFGNVIWVGTYTNGDVSELASNGVVVNTYGCVSPYQVAIDPSENVWTTDDQATGEVCKISSTGSVTAYTGNFFGPTGIATDSSGNIWVVNTETIGNVVKMGNTGNVLGIYAVGNVPVQIAIDGSGNAWITNSASNTVTKLSSSGTTLGTYSGVGNDPQGIAINSAGDVWVTSYSNSIVTELSSSGNVLGSYSVGSDPQWVAIDGGGNVFVTNLGGSSVTKLSSSGSLLGTYSISAGDVEGIAIDGSGNAWIASEFDEVEEISNSGNVIGTYSVTGEAIGVAIN